MAVHSNGLPGIDTWAAARGVVRLRSSSARVLDGMARKITSLENVLASPPTRTEGAAFAASSINSANAGGTAGTYRWPISSQLITPLGTPSFASDGTQYNMRPQTLTRVAGDVLRSPGGLSGFGFTTSAQVFDFCAALGSQNWIMYVTDPLTGDRRRAAADDFTNAVTYTNFNKFDFGSRALREIEIYLPSGSHIFGVNAASGETISPLILSEPKVGLIWDSWGEGSISDSGTLNNVRLNVATRIAALLGCRNPWSFAVGGTGVLATNAGTLTSAQQRVAAGDVDYTRVGHFDIIFAMPSLNDYSASQGGTTNDATFQAAYQAYIASIMIAQPRAIIVGAGPQSVSGSIQPQSRFDAAKAGFLAAAGSDPRMIYLNNAPNAGNYLYGTGGALINSIMIGPDNYHATKLGSQYYATRLIADLRPQLDALIAA